MKFLAFWQKCFNCFWQNVDTILEEVSVGLSVTIVYLYKLSIKKDL